MTNEINMPLGYFHCVAKETPTRFWINNPMGPDLKRAIEAGAINVTTNPSYCSKLIQTDPEYIRGVIDEVIKDVPDNDVAADLVYQKVTMRVMSKFLPLYERSGGTYGYVTIQADPREDNDPDAIVEAALQHRRLGKNYMAKIPVIPAGAQAIETMVAENIPICATEVFSISQAVYIGELYQRAVKKYGKHPLFYVTHITGIFDEYLQRVVERDGVDIAPKILGQAGCAVARKEYRILKKRGYEVTLLGGGARGPQHFTEFVGGDVHITINWSLAQELIEADGEIVSRIDVETSPTVIDELCEKLPNFKKAFQEDGLSPEEFENFGPLQFFRNSFLEGYYRLLAEIVSCRALHPVKQE